MRDRKIGVLCGGLSTERDVSLKSGEAIHAALCARGYDAERIFVDRDLDLVLRQARIDVAFLALHGRFGEDGCVQGLLEMLGIPYTGSGVLASALALHKAKAKEVFQLRNLPTPASYVLRQERTTSLAEEHGSFGFPVVVKPVTEGSSIGVSVAHDLRELELACEEAFAFDDELLVERFITGVEVSVAILNDRPLGTIEIVPADDFYDFGAKTTEGRSTFHLPARLPAERMRGLQKLALSAHRALGCSGATRVDLIVAERGNEYILEVNTIPGMTPTSLLSRIAAHAGIDFGALVEEQLLEARLPSHGKGRHERRLHVRAFPGPERRADGAPPRH